MKKIITHNGSFHADDVFSVATVKMWLEKTSPKKIFGKNKIKVIRTRDPKIIATGDIVVDIGGEYDPVKKIFDHHQIGGAGKRNNGIPYAAFGLVWKKYGNDLCGSQIVTNDLDTRIVQPIDATDNAVNLCQLVYPNVQPYFLSSLIGVYNFVSKKNKGESLDSNFLQAVAFAEDIIKREIEMSLLGLEKKQYVEEAYQKAEDKRIVILDKDVCFNSWGFVLSGHPEPLFVVKPDRGSENWRVKTVRGSLSSFESRKDLPQKWAGKAGKELTEETGVEGSIFCHNKRFVIVADTKEGAIQLARLAVS